MRIGPHLLNHELPTMNQFPNLNIFSELAPGKVQNVPFFNIYGQFDVSRLGNVAVLQELALPEPPKVKLVLHPPSKPIVKEEPLILKLSIEPFIHAIDFKMSKVQSREDLVIFGHSFQKDTKKREAEEELEPRKRIKN